MALSKMSEIPEPMEFHTCECDLLPSTSGGATSMTSCTWCVFNYSNTVDVCDNGDSDDGMELDPEIYSKCDHCGSSPFLGPNGPLVESACGMCVGRIHSTEMEVITQEEFEAMESDGFPNDQNEEDIDIDGGDDDDDVGTDDDIDDDEYDLYDSDEFSCSEEDSDEISSSSSSSDDDEDDDDDDGNDSCYESASSSDDDGDDIIDVVLLHNDQEDESDSGYTENREYLLNWL